MKVQDTFLIKDRGMVVLVREIELPRHTRIGSTFSLDEQVWKLSGVENIHYGAFGAMVPSDIEKRTIGLLFAQCEGTETWPQKGDELKVKRLEIMRVQQCTEYAHPIQTRTLPGVGFCCPCGKYYGPPTRKVEWMTSEELTRLARACAEFEDQ